MKHLVAMTVNGRAVRGEVEPRTHLADFLREDLLLTGTHLGCEHGVCGACTVLIDGAPARACIAFAVACDGSDIRTVEGFADDPIMVSLRAAFSRHHALQCGYCTPGMLVTAHDIVTRLPDADDARIREELAGNLCRCTGYLGIVEAIQSVLGDAQAPRRDAVVASPRELAVALPRPGPAVTQATGAGAGKLDAGRYRMQVPVGADALWSVLEDVSQVARCLPGAAIDGDADARPVAFCLNIAMGPMRIAFIGTADVVHDRATRSGSATGRGEDARTRSAGEGGLQFSVAGVDDQRSELTVSLDYTLTGPLAQFSRGPVVDAAVERMLEDFAANASRMARGEAVEDRATVGGVGLTLRALLRRFIDWLPGRSR